MELIVEDLEFGYNSSTLLENIDFSAKRGKILGILGQNGCGKTTLLKCIDRMLKPKGGSIMIENPPVDIFNKGREEIPTKIDTSELDRKELSRCVSVVSQSSYISFPYTSFDAVKMGRYARHAKSKEEDNEAVFKAMMKAGALEFAKRPVNELSGGELRRVMIARALAQEPSILLLDEPTLHLDVNHQFDLMDLITDLKNESDMVVIMVTHDMMFAARYCDEIILMEKGHIIKAGKTEDVLTSETIKEAFGIDAIVEKDDRVGGLNVLMIGKHKD